MDMMEQVNIFIVDDNRVFALALRSGIEIAFKNTPIKIYLFGTGEKCMERFEELKPQLVILDYFLNGRSQKAVDGLQVLDKIKNINGETKVIMLTSNEQIEIALRSFRHGASDYVVKNENQFKKINNSISKIFAKKELRSQKEERDRKEVELMIADKELGFQNIENEKRAAELILSNIELELRNEEKEKQAIELNTVSIQKEAAERSKRVLEEKNKSITDSINYASRIQKAKLPRKEEIYSSLSQSFVLFKPKDIVSGDFYFFQESKNLIFIAAADCTGHGVPGAFMSMIGSEKLNEALALSSNTSEILKRLNKGIKNSLHQTGSTDSTRDGMDIAICSIDTEKKIVKYAGANRPFWLIRKGSTEMEEIKATKIAIGGLTDNEQHFESHELQLQEGDTFYIFTDGYADQFGAVDGKKLMTRKFREILLKIQDLPMPEQEKYLEEFIESWKEGIVQVDDILVIGVRL